MIQFFVYAVLYTILDFFSEKICMTCSALKRHSRVAMSFAAGITIGYLFLELFPRIFAEAGDLMVPYVLSMLSLTGFFVVHHYLHEKQADVYVYKEAHLAVRSVYHMIIGGVLFYLPFLPWGEAVTIALPVFLHTAFSSLMHHKVKYAKKSVLKRHHIKWFKVASLLSTLVGAVVAFWLSIPFSVFIILLSIVSGGMIYVVVSEYLRESVDVSIPSLLTGEALFFVLLVALRWFG